MNLNKTITEIDDANRHVDFIVWSFTCAGLKSTCELVERQLQSVECKMLFLSEHWFTPMIFWLALGPV